MPSPKAAPEPAGPSLEEQIAQLQHQLSERDEMVELWNTRYNAEHERGLNLDLTLQKTRKALRTAQAQLEATQQSQETIDNV